MLISITFSVTGSRQNDDLLPSFKYNSLLIKNKNSNKSNTVSNMDCKWCKILERGTAVVEAVNSFRRSHGLVMVQSMVVSPYSVI